MFQGWRRVVRNLGPSRPGRNSRRFPRIRRNRFLKFAKTQFEGRDKSKDGKLTRYEFLANQPDPDKAPDRFTRFDTYKDGELSREEFITEGKSGPGSK